jgi:hypothetical protein
MDGERFNELKIARFSGPKPDLGFKTLYAGSQLPQFGAFFGFDFAGGGLGYFDVKVIEVRDLIEGIVNGEDCFPSFRPRQRAHHRCNGAIDRNEGLGAGSELIEQGDKHGFPTSLPKSRVSAPMDAPAMR